MIAHSTLPEFTATIKNHIFPWGDILITARQEVQGGGDCYFLTEDKEDFTSLLFDRITVISFERIDRDGKDYLQHLQLLKFNHQKFSKCLENLPQ